MVLIFAAGSVDAGVVDTGGAVGVGGVTALGAGGGGGVGAGAGGGGGGSIPRF
tara:strand:- start:521 stop:679 length:159 start_codon:yes stop_codon:yes gene_type:complete